MRVIIPAAGYATRLYPLTKDTPKPLLEVAGKPIIGHILEKVKAVQGVKEAVVVTNDRFYDKFVEWKDKVSFPVPITILNDGTTSNENRLGAIGDKWFAIRELGIDDDVLDISSDNMFSFELTRLYDCFKKKGSAVIGLFDVKDKGIAKRMGVVELGQKDKVTFFVEKPEVARSTLVSIGTYIYPRRVTRLFKTYIEEGNNPDQPGRFIEWLYEREEVFGCRFDREGDAWFDVGSFESLEEARKFFRK